VSLAPSGLVICTSFNCPRVRRSFRTDQLGAVSSAVLGKVNGPLYVVAGNSTFFLGR